MSTMNDNKSEPKRAHVPSIGIDLGTTYSCVGTYRNGSVSIIPNDLGMRTTPSYVSFTDSERLIGNAAKDQSSRNNTNTIYDAKRLIGRKYTDSTVQKDIKLWPFKVIKNTFDDRPLIEVTFCGERKRFFAEQISSMILEYLLQISNDFVGKPVKNAVITVPAYFNDLQRQATKDAGLIAGLNVLRIINEPTAAAIAYGLNNKKSVEDTVLIFDLGGGTFDVSLLSIDDGVFEVLATSGDTHLGGEDFDHILVEYFCGEFKRKHKLDLKSSKKAIARLKNACEKAKRILSNSNRTNIELDSLYEGIDFYTTLTKAKFEQLCQSLFSECLKPIERVLMDSKLSKNEISEIVLVGGSTRIPKIQSMITQFFNGKALCKSINPDEAVAYGAAIQAHLLSGNQFEEDNNFVLLDVTPLSLGIETAGGIMTKLISRQKKIPCKASEVFTTFKDNQSGVSIKVFEGERELTQNNNLLGSFDLEGIPPMPRGIPQIEIEFNIDADGILKVLAKDKKNESINKSITIDSRKGQLTEEEILQMIKESENMKEKDLKIKEKIELKNELDGLCYKIKNSINNNQIKNIQQSEKEELFKEIDSITYCIENNSNITTEQLKEFKNKLESLWKPIVMKNYSQSQSEPQPETNNSNVSADSSGPTIDEID